MATWRYDGLTYERWPTRTVRIGDVEIGSRHPIRVQSMTTPLTKDTQATVDQIERLVAAGCEIVRVTVPTSGDADALPAIRSELGRLKIRVPLVADIHFTPAAAMKAVEHVEKIRINPGNFADKKKFAVREYTDVEYDAELARIAETFTPLVRRAKELGVAMRIGTNHGSLSDRIMNRYGDTPEGMVESAMEFVRICRDLDYHELVLSMKASNPVIVQQVYRSLVSTMTALGMDYPIHLGVTEAGDGEDGRLKSALGIGTLLEEGIGDTVRVSLTEDPVAEIPVALRLVERFNRLMVRPDSRAPGLAPALRGAVREARDPLSYMRRPGREMTVGPRRIGAGAPVLVEVPLASPLDAEADIRHELDREAGVRVPEEVRAELVSVSVDSEAHFAVLSRLRQSMELVAPKVALSGRVGFDWRTLDPGTWDELLTACHRIQISVEAPLGPQDRERLGRLLTSAAGLGTRVLVESCGPVEAAVEAAVEIAEMDRELGTSSVMLALGASTGLSALQPYRLLAARLGNTHPSPPVVLVDDADVRAGDALLGASIGIGGVLCDGVGDAVQLRGQPAGDSRKLGFGILQAARVRITKTEFISCPSCGRTLFDLEETTARIKQRTSHLKGVKIAVMGCIVNGPGEMADADFGYVGWGEDKIALFVGKDMVAKDIPTGKADERLVELIKQHGRWVEPPVPAGESA